MSNISSHDQIFLDKLRQKIEQNMSAESFGVAELADEVGMSRSNLLRKIKKLTGLSVSQLIREVRLENAMHLLKEGGMNVSEVSDHVGFASTSYFIKCFREEFGYPPGEVSKRDIKDEENTDVDSGAPFNNKTLIVAAVAIVILVSGFLLLRQTNNGNTNLEKSIAVLPFKNDSADSSNVYLVNGLMESTLNNLQKIGDLRVVSRTSTEKYRTSPKSIPEIAEELNVSYFVEGSGQKNGNRILLNIQLIEASTDRQLWASQYERDSKDIFQLQQEIASTIANEIKAIITPAEREQISKIPTSNLVAYDNYLKGRNLLVMGDDEKITNSVRYFKKAIELDENFSQAYSALAISYFYLDLFQSQKLHTQDIKDNADKAMSIDSNSPESLMAMALYYQHSGDYPKEVEYLEEALELAPNNVEIINMLSDLYANYMPDTNKYLEYALRGIQLNSEAYDSLTTSYLYLHLSNALIQNGFVDEALYYINRSLDYSDSNGFSNYVKAFILYAKEKDVSGLRRRLIVEWQKDSSRLDILQEIGKVNYFMEDYDSAYHYYRMFVDMREAANFSIYTYENDKIAAVFEIAGKEEEAKGLYKDYLEYVATDQSVYRDALYLAYYAKIGETDKAIEHLREFAKNDNFQFWLILFDSDPSMKSLESIPEAQQLWKKIHDKFWRNHDALRADLEEKGLI
ncbi:MAG: helix-turn-helix domain-containing protein [Cytophagia bacterium]|nr:helix-turn-helix domain-containing protein [Cytophagia bacterium]